MNRHKKYYILSVIVLFVLSATGTGAQQNNTDSLSRKRPLTVRDMMKFKSIKKALISEDGKWLIYSAQPDRGDGEVMVYSLDGEIRPYERIVRGKKPAVSKDGRWVAVLLAPEAKETKEEKKDKEKPKTGMTLLNTVTGKMVTADNIKSFAFSENSGWMISQCYPNDKKKGKTEKKGKKKKENKWAKKAFNLLLRHLPLEQVSRIDNVIYYALDPSCRYLAYSTYTPRTPPAAGTGDTGKAKGSTDKTNGLFIKDLQKPGTAVKPIHAEDGAIYSNLTWSKTKSRLAFIFHRQKEKKGKDKKTFSSGIWVWDGIKNKRLQAVNKKQIPKGWMIPAENKLQWTKDGERLFFGFKPYYEYIRTLDSNADIRENGDSNGGKDTSKEGGLYNIGRILAKRGVDVWHWNDSKIIPHQKKEWERFRKQTYPAVYHFRLKTFIPLTDTIMPRLDIPENPDTALGFSSRPYLREITWDGRYRDVYISHLGTGFRQKMLTRHPRLRRDDISLSPNGKFAVYYKDKHWYLYDVRLKFVRRLTADIKTPFYNEDHDYPSDVPGYGIAGWTENDRSVIIYDKYDIWEFFTGSKTNKYACVTGGEGRKNELGFRIQKTDPDAKFFKKHEKCLLTAFSDEEKYTAFYRATLGKTGVQKLLQEKKKFTFLKKAKKADRIIFTRESFDEFPDIWVSDLSLKSPRKVTDVNPWKKDFLWGNAELLEWKSLDGTRLQGVVIKPENYDSSKRYPVLVYFYRFFSQRLYDFNEVVVNHRPCFPFYTGHDYVVFLPDVRFDIGHPGNSAFKCIVPGVQKLIDDGIADPKAVGIHGHSWSGYQTAFIITQTKMFAAAVAGAPVSNMTSAYSGIRWQSGLARQFQYEKSQSRIGKNLWESPELYIENSPVFFAPQVETPLLIQFGDKDGAVPWYQGIELYLAMRRLDKNCIFLQYNDEPHQLKKYPNKLDYTIKMKEYLDHYLKGKPAPEWISKGVPYKKK
ncbi:MAG: S9 family peptidase [bacterium]|nr:S9 family peptidase [bacterium]